MESYDELKVRCWSLHSLVLRTCQAPVQIPSRGKCVCRIQQHKESHRTNQILNLLTPLAYTFYHNPFLHYFLIQTLESRVHGHNNLIQVPQSFLKVYVIAAQLRHTGFVESTNTIESIAPQRLDQFTSTSHGCSV